MSKSPRPVRSFRRRTAFRLMLAAVVLVAVEAVSFAVFWIVDGAPFSYARLADEQRAVATTADEATSREGGQGALLQPCVHPYTGFVYHERLNTGNWKRDTGQSVNRFGFCDGNDPIQKRSPDKVLVAIFGGSVAAWVGLRGAEALVAELAQSPRHRGKELVVLKFAVGGHKQPQQLMVLNWILAQGGELDLAINIDGFNECFLTPNNVLARIHPLYPTLWQQLVGDVSDREQQRRIGRVVHLRAERQGWAAGFDDSWWQRSVTAQLVWRLQDRRLAARIAAASQLLETYVPDALPFEVRGPGTDGYSMDNIGTTVADVWQRCSLQMHRLCAANGIEYHHVLQPNQYVPDSKPMGDAERAKALLPESMQAKAVQEGYPVLASRIAALREQGVRVHDLRTVFADVEEPLYIDPFCHVNDLGSQLIGRRIGREIGGR